MRTKTAILGLALLSAAPPALQAQSVPPDSLALARQYTTWLLAGETDSLVAHVAEGVSSEFGTPEFWTQATNTISMRAGEEVVVLDESWKPRNGDCQYWRTSEFSAMSEWLLIRWVLDAEGRIEGVGMGPESQAPPTDGDTCGVPPGAL
jgi:hypothetical protein